MCGQGSLQRLVLPNWGPNEKFRQPGRNVATTTLAYVEPFKRGPASPFALRVERHYFTGSVSSQDDLLESFFVFDRENGTGRSFGPGSSCRRGRQEDVINTGPGLDCTEFWHSRSSRRTKQQIRLPNCNLYVRYEVFQNIVFRISLGKALWSGL